MLIKILLFLLLTVYTKDKPVFQQQFYNPKGDYCISVSGGKAVESCHCHTMMAGCLWVYECGSNRYRRVSGQLPG